jgi:N-acetylmuramoyl-L-alanine amidase
MRNVVRCLILFAAQWVIFPLAAHAAPLVAFEVGKANETITISVPQAAPHKVFFVPNPDRLVVDVPSIGGKQAVDLPAGYKGKLVKAARFGQFDPSTSRFVFDLNMPARLVDKTVQGKKPMSLVITLTAAPAGSKPIAVEKNAQPDGGKVKNLAEGTKPKATPTTGNKNSKPSGAENRKAASAKPAKAVIPVVVIDAGHGGVDPGAIGPAGTLEKDVVLQYARELKSRMDKTGRYRTVLTRTGDTFIPLRGRVAIARKAGAHLFVSLHADSASEASARGLSVYTVSETASDKEAEALAARENKSDIIAGMNLGDAREDVADILISLAQRETRNSSAIFADIVVAIMSDKVRLLPNAHRFAGFAVLKAPDVPSVLIEVGFLSHPQEERLIKTKAYRDKVIEGIMRGIDVYFAKHPPLTRGE